MLQIKWDMRSKMDRQGDKRIQETRPILSGIIVPDEEPLPPAFGGRTHEITEDFRRTMNQAVQAWLTKTPSAATREKLCTRLATVPRFSSISCR